MPYGPGCVKPGVYDKAITLADLAPSEGVLLHFDFAAPDGQAQNAGAAAGRRSARPAADGAAFKYNLSACLSAARSVTFFLQKEHDAVPDFHGWWASKQADFRADERMTLFNNKRVETVHIRPVSPDAHLQVEVHEVVHMADAIIVQKVDDAGTTIEERRAESPPPAPAEPRPARVEWRWHFDELLGIDVVTASEEQLGKLRLLVDECEGKFGRLE